MNTRYLIVLVLLAAPYVARGDTLRYVGIEDQTIPIDGAAATLPIEPEQFIEPPFSELSLVFVVSEGYESEFISMGTPTSTANASMLAQTVTESVSVSPSAAAASVPAPTTPTNLVFNAAVGVHTFDTETGIDIGVYCMNPTITIVGDPIDRIFRLICPEVMEM